MHVPEASTATCHEIAVVVAAELMHECFFVEEVKQLTAMKLDSIDQKQGEVCCWQSRRAQVH